jgi:hypothetical protein
MKTWKNRINKKKTWKNRLNKKERKHLSESKINTKFDLDKQKEHLKSIRMTDPFFCWDCKHILMKLKMWDEEELKP